MIAIVDYGVGNLFSLTASLNYLGIANKITADQDELHKAERIILPGVGAFGDAAAKLRAAGLDQFLCEQAHSGKPLLGICLGMQLLFEKSYEYGEHRGLGLIKGQIRPLQAEIPADLQIPHIGWNDIRVIDWHPLLKNSKAGDYFYFVHSYYAADCAESLLAVAEYGIEVPAFVASGSVMGSQCHPEKSGKAGLALLTAFNEFSYNHKGGRLWKSFRR